jgi:hypothetical protein
MSVMDGKVVVRDWVRLTDRLSFAVERDMVVFRFCPALVFRLLFLNGFMASDTLYMLNNVATMETEYYSLITLFSLLHAMES